MLSNPKRNDERSSIKSFSEKRLENVTKEIWKDFIRHCVVIQQLNPRSTVPDRIRKLKYLERNGIDLLNFDENQVHSLFFKKLEQGSPNTAVNNYIKALNSWTKFRDIDIKFNKFKEHQKPVKVPSIDDIRVLLDVVSERRLVDRRDRMIIIFFCKTGLRCQELCDLKLDDIDWKNSEILIRKGKGGKERIVPIERKVLAGINYPSLKNYIKNWRLPIGDWVFTTPSGQITTAYIRKRIKVISKRAGVPWVHPHSFRHFYATNLIRSGAKITVVQELLGHADIGSTACYLHVAEAELRDTVQKMPILDIIRKKGSKDSSKNNFRRFYAKSTGRF